MRRRDQATIEELAELLDGTRTSEDARKGVQALATLAREVSESSEVAAPTPAFRTRLRAELIEEIDRAEVSLAERVRDAFWEKTARWRNSARVGVATAVFASMVGSAGVAAAAQQALPGEMLYPVKQATESLRLSLASGDVATGRLHLAFARERLEELEDGAGELTPDEVVSTLQRMDDATIAGTNELIAAVQAGQPASLLDTVATFTNDQQISLIRLMDRLPYESRPFVEDSLEVLRHIGVRLSDVAGCDCLNAAATGLDTDSSLRPGEGPALGPDGCPCVPAAEPAASGQTADGETGDAPAVSDGATTAPTGSLPGDPDGAGEPSGTIGDVTGEVGETVGTITGQLGDGVGSTVDNVLPTPTPSLPTVGGTVGDTAGQVGDTAGQVGDTVGDTTTGVTDTATGTVGGVTDTASDTVTDTTTSVTDTVTGTVGGATGSTTASPSPTTSPAPTTSPTGSVGGTVQDATNTVTDTATDTVGGLLGGG